jgi:hypothetical protein
MLNNGVSPIVVNRHLGHSKASTTLNLYAQLLPSKEAEGAQLINDLMMPIALQPIAPELHRAIKNAGNCYRNVKMSLIDRNIVGNASNIVIFPQSP